MFYNSIFRECLKLQSKYEKTNKLEKTGTNVTKTAEAKKAYLASKDRFEKSNRLLMLELPQFYEKRVDYFQPCLQALIRAQVNNSSYKAIRWLTDKLLEINKWVDIKTRFRLLFLQCIMSSFKNLSWYYHCTTQWPTVLFLIIRQVSVSSGSQQTEMKCFQVDYYGETTRLFTHLVATKQNSKQIVQKSDRDFQEDMDKKFADLKSLSIIGKWTKFIFIQNSNSRNDNLNWFFS